MKQFLKNRWFKDQHGGIMLVSAFTIPVVMVAAGLAVDLNRYMRVSGYIQSAVDQAALAAAAADSNQESIARKFYNASLSANVREYVNSRSVEVSVIPPTATSSLAVAVNASANVDTVFGRIFGFTNFEMAKSARAERFYPEVEAVLALASGGTMCARKERIPNTSNVLPGETNVALRPDPACTSFEAMKSGVRGFIDNLGANGTVDSLKVGLVPYNYKVKMPDQTRIPPSLLANEEASFFSDVSDAEPLTQVHPLTSDMGSLRSFVEDMTLTVNATAWSRSDLGSHVAALMLDPTQRQFFPGGEEPAALGDDNANKIFVLMSDGVNSGCCYTNWPLGNFSNQYIVSNRDYNRDQVEICRAMKEEGVEIFTILFDIQDTDSGGLEINDVFARCATPANAEIGDSVGNGDGLIHCRDRQNCFNVSTPDELELAFRQISGRFFRPVLTQ